MSKDMKGRTDVATESSAATTKAEYHGGVLPMVWRLLGSRRRELAMALILRTAASLTLGIPVIVVVWVVQNVRTDSLTSQRAMAATLIVLGGFALQYLLSFASNAYAWTSTFLAVADARIETLRHIQRLPVPVVTSRRVGDISAVLTADFEAVSNFAHAGLITMIGGAALPVGAVIGLTILDPLLGATVAVSIIASIPVFLLVNRAFERRAIIRADLLADANSRIVEYVHGVATARSYNQAGARQRWYRDAVARMRQVNDEMAVKLTPLVYVSIGTLMLGIPLVIAVTGYRLLGGTVDVGTAVVFLVIVLRVYEPLFAVATQVEPLRLADAALQRIRRLHDLPPQDTPQEAVATPQGHDITFDHVGFGYDTDRPVLVDVSFTAEAGRTTAIVGPSGAGKSTILALASRFYDPDTGFVHLGGIPLTELTSDQVFQAVTIVFQDVYLFAGTIRDNIAFGAPDTDDAAIVAVARAARCHEFIEALPNGYATRIGEGGMTLSGGERQRLSIARAMLKDAPVVLLDEATSALDPLNEEAVAEALNRLCAGRTVIVVAHRLSTIRSADQILVVADGRIVQRGRHADLLASGGLYARLWSQRERASRWRLGADRPGPRN